MLSRTASSSGMQNLLAARKWNASRFNSGSERKRKLQSLFSWVEPPSSFLLELDVRLHYIDWNYVMGKSCCGIDSYGLNMTGKIPHSWFAEVFKLTENIFLSTSIAVGNVEFPINQYKKCQQVGITSSEMSHQKENNLRGSCFEVEVVLTGIWTIDADDIHRSRKWMLIITIYISIPHICILVGDSSVIWKMENHRTGPILPPVTYIKSTIESLLAQVSFTSDVPLPRRRI